MEEVSGSVPFRPRELMGADADGARSLNSKLGSLSSVLLSYLHIHTLKQEEREWSLVCCAMLKALLRGGSV